MEPTSNTKLALVGASGESSSSVPTLTRRTAIRGAAAVAGAAWLAPVVAVVVVSPAVAASQAPPPGPTGGGTTGGGEVVGESGAPSHSEQQSTQAFAAKSGAPALAFTGSDIEAMTAAGIAVLAAGAGAIRASRRLRLAEEQGPQASPEPTPDSERAAG